MYNIIIWGTGNYANKLVDVIEDTIIFVIDNDEKKWGSIWNGYVVNSPSCLNDFNLDFEKIIIAVADWRTVRQQIINDFHVDMSMVENVWYRRKEALLEGYKGKAEDDQIKYISYLKNHPLDVFNDYFTEKYEMIDPEVYYDALKDRYYVYHNKKRMYFSSKFSSEKQVKEYYRGLLIEQDEDSPHRYLTKEFQVYPHEMVLDAGVAEGNFALDIVERVDKLYLVEADKNWIEALQYTFEPYRDKVEIIEGILGSGLEGEITIDSIINGRKLDFIKMDIEGTELDALCGAEQTLKQNNVKLDVCVYHNFDDEKNIEKLLEENGYETEASNGYMVFFPKKFYEKEEITPKFVRGLLRGKRRNEYV